MAGLTGGTGGGDAGAIEAGKAFVKMGLKDETRAGLRQLAERMKAAGADISKAFEGGAAGKLFGEARGGGAGAAGLVGVGLAVAAVADRWNRVTGATDLASDAMDLFQIKVFGAATGTETLKRETEEWGRALEKAARDSDRLTALARRALKFEEDPQEQMRILERDEVRLRAENLKAVEEFARIAEAHRRATESAAPHEEIARLQAQMDAAREAAAKFRDEVEATEDAIRELKRTLSEETTRGLDDLVGAALKEQVDRIAAIRTTFQSEVERAVLANRTGDLSPDDASLAALITAGLSNEMIMSIRAARGIQNRLAAETMVAGGFAGDLDARSLGGAPAWQRLEKQQELTNERLESIRKELDTVNTKLGFK